MQANLFQVVMATDGMKSFVIFIYADIKWGEGGMGFNAGDGVKSFTLPGSLTATARDIEYGSNVDIASLYAYRVDLPNISSPGGKRSATYVDHKLLQGRKLITCQSKCSFTGTEFSTQCNPNFSTWRQIHCKFNNTHELPHHLCLVRTLYNIGN